MRLTRGAELPSQQAIKESSMKVIALTTAQQSQAASLKAAVISAQAALIAANKALNTYLVSISGIKVPHRNTLTDDGTAVVTQ